MGKIDRWNWASWICFTLDLVFKHFSYWVLENEIFEIFFAISAKEEWEGGSENSGKNLLTPTRCICGWPLMETFNKIGRKGFPLILWDITLNFVDPLNSELPEFSQILVFLTPAFTIKNNLEFVQFVEEGKTS